MEVKIKNVDNDILYFIDRTMNCSFMDKIMTFATHLGNLGVIWIAISIMLLLSNKYKYAVYMVILGIALTSIIGEGIIKHIFQRNRPFQDIICNKTKIKMPKSYSFPSGHTASSFAAAEILSVYFVSLRPLLFLIASLIAFSRI